MEVVDPATFSGTATDTLGGDCAVGETCRWSDAALLSVNNTLAKKGTIARTVGWNQYEAPTVIKYLNADTLFYVDGKADEAAYIGLELEKLGRSTGWTLGEVIRTCEDITVDGLTRLCSDTIDSGTQRGDSGAPVFYSLGDGWVTAYGIVWAGVRWDWERTIYSPFENIDYEFDPLNVNY